MLKHVVTMIEFNLIAIDYTVIINNAMDASGAQLNIKIFTHTQAHRADEMTPKFEVRFSIIKKLPVHEVGSYNRFSC